MTTPASLSSSIDLSVYNKYLWRGINTSNKAVLQPSVNLSYSQFNLNIWGNMELTNANNANYGKEVKSKFTEIDYTLSYGHSINMFNVEMGLIHYRFPHTGSNPTTEAFGSVAVDTLLNPSYALYWDIDSASGGFYNHFGLGHQFSKVLNLFNKVYLSVDLAAHLGFGSSKYNLAYFSENSGHFTDYSLAISFPIQGESNWTIVPQAAYTSLVNKRIREKVSFKKDNYVLGINLNASF